MHPNPSVHVPTFVSHDGTRLAYKVLGNLKAPRTIVFVNGLFTTDGYWAYLWRALAPEWRLVTFDLRGHGRSDPPANPAATTIEDLALDVRALLDHLEIDRAVMAGFSLGVQAVFEGWRLFPERILAIMTFLGPYQNPLATLYGLEVSDKTWERLLRPLADRIPNVTQTLWHGTFHLPSPLIHTVARLSRATRASGRDMQFFYDHQKVVHVPTGLRMALSAIQHSARDVLPTITVPTLVVAGGKDTFTPASLSEVMRDEIPGVDFLLVPEASHAGLLEMPELINERVRLFLDANLPAARKL